MIKQPTPRPKQVKILFGFLSYLGIERYKTYDVVPCPKDQVEEYGEHVWVISDTTGKPFLLQRYEYDIVKDDKLKRMMDALDALD